MIVAESRRGRRIVGRLDRGADLVPALLEMCAACNVRSGEVRALGALEQVEVCEYDQGARTYRASRRFAAQLEVLALHGNVSELDGRRSLHLHATLSRERDNGIEVIGGHLVSARVFSLEVVIDAWDDLLLRRMHDPATGLSLWREAVATGGAHEELASAASAPAPEREPISPAQRPPVGGGSSELRSDEGGREGPPPFVAPARGRVVAAGRPDGTSWADVMASSAAREAEEEEAIPAADAERLGGGDGEEAVLHVGDVLLHPTFGRCVIERLDDNSEYAAVRLKNQRLVRLSLDVLETVPSGVEGDGGRRAFKVRVK